MNCRCAIGLHKWSKWDLLHRWCLRCRTVEYTDLGKAIMGRLAKEIMP